MSNNFIVQSERKSLCSENAATHRYQSSTTRAGVGKRKTSCSKDSKTEVNKPHLKENSAEKAFPELIPKCLGTSLRR